MRNEWFKELWRYRELLYFLALRDVKIRYKQAALGVGWAILQPLLNMLVFTLFFGKLAGVPSDGIPYPLFTYCALVLWTYFAAVIGQAGQSLVANSSLVTKVYFPRITLPASSSVGALVDILFGFVLLALMMVYYRVPPSWSLLWVPVFVFALILAATGTSLVLAALNVRYRDIKYVIPFLVQFWLFVTPVIYPTSLIPERFRAFAALNPLAGIIEGFRACLFPGRSIDLILTGASFAATLVVFVIGVVYFRKTERTFADII